MLNKLEAVLRILCLKTEYWRKNFSQVLSHSNCKSNFIPFSFPQITGSQEPHIDRKSILRFTGISESVQIRQETAQIFDWNFSQTNQDSFGIWRSLISFVLFSPTLHFIISSEIRHGNIKINGKKKCILILFPLNLFQIVNQRKPSPLSGPGNYIRWQTNNSTICHFYKKVNLFWGCNRTQQCHTQKRIILFCPAAD